MLKIKNSNKFKSDLKKFKFNNHVINELSKVLGSLCKQEALAEKYRDHSLMGIWSGHRECHLKPDVLLIYMTDETTVFLERIGSHAELF